MSEKYTQGKLAICQRGVGFEIEHAHGNVIAQVQQIPDDQRHAKRKANARRIAACWNACEGLPTDVLENITTMGDTLASRFKARDKTERELTAQRDELLEALLGMAYLYDTDDGCKALPQYVAARAVIAKATGENHD